MQDRLKFRYYSAIDKKMYDVSLLDYDEPSVCTPIYAKYGKYFSETDFDPEQLMQCTGLKDKNGRLIYEGDILGNIETFKGVIYQAPLEVVWEDGGFCLKGDYTTNKGTLRLVRYNADNINELELIGNKYE